MSPGFAIGHYRVTAKLGEGGMGVVYRALDTKLNREVAIKILPGAFAADSERMARFAREAQVLASLNHPNIAAIYGIEEGAMIMELVEGASLGGPVPLETALDYARQIAAGLSAAHEKGIVHRDLKPANIKVTPKGTVKLLDFGLAKTREARASAAAADPDVSPTESLTMTTAGTILGTAAYMAPEQARGKAVDKRADIWTFGVVLYEVLTGRRLFQGEDVAEILASVVKETPDLGRTPPEVRRLLAACLERNPENRLHDITDWRLLLDAPSSAAAKPQRAKWLWIAATLLAIGGAAVVLRFLSFSAAPAAFTFSIAPPPATRLVAPSGVSSPPLISPDGSTLLFKTESALYVRRFDSEEAKPLLGSEHATNVAFWAADSRSVAYLNGTELVRVRLPDGAPERIAAYPTYSRGGSWSTSGVILISGAQTLFYAPASGGELKLVSGLPDGFVLYPEFIPGSDEFLFLDVKEREGSICLATLREGKAENVVQLLTGGSPAHYTPAGGGRLLFVRNDNLYSRKINLAIRRLEGEATLVVKGVANYPSGNLRTADFSVARNGTVAWRPGGAASTRVAVFNRTGRIVDTAGPAGYFRDIALSPDGTHVLASSSESSSLMEVGKSGELLLPSGVFWRRWVRGSNGVILVGSRPTLAELVQTTVEGSGQPRAIAPLPKSISNGGFGWSDLSADGSKALFTLLRSAVPPVSRPALLSVLVKGGAADPVTLLETPEPVFSARFSPDGRWVVYEVGLKSRTLFVRTSSGLGSPRQIAVDGASPVWRRDGKEIVYWSGESVMSISVQQAGGELRFSDPHILFSGIRRPPGLINSNTPLAVSHDGSRILWLQGPDQPDANLIHIRLAAIQ
jgi:serine/threonine protein kinase